MRSRRPLFGLLASAIVVAACSPGLRAQTPAELVAAGHVRIRTSLEPEEVLVGQRAQLTVEVLTDSWFLAAPAYPQTLDIANAVVIPPGAFGVNSSERIGGTTFAVQARTYEVFPVAPGRVPIPPVEVTVVVALSDASRSEPIALKGEALVLTASVPEAARGLGLVVATPRLQVEERWSRSLEGLRVGGAVTRTVTQRVEGSVPMVLSLPRFEDSGGVGVYPERPVFEQRSDRGELSGSRTDAVSYVFEEEGRLLLSAVELPWWDLGAEELRRELLPAVILEIAANPDLSAEHLQAPSDESDVVEASPPSRRDPPYRLVLAVGALLALVWSVRHGLGRLFARLRGWTSRPDDPEARAWTELQRALARRDRGQVLARLYRWRDTLEGLPGPPTLEALAGDSQLGAIFRVLQDPESKSEWDHGHLVSGLATVRDQWRRGPGNAPGAALGPLNPTRLAAPRSRP